MNKIAADPTQPYRSLIAGYTDAIRQSDFKANIAFLFVAFMMGSVLWNYTSFPSYLSVQLVLAPFLIVYFFLFMVLIPRYPKRGAKSFLVARNLTPADFQFRRPDCRRPRTVKAHLRRSCPTFFGGRAVVRVSPRVDRLRVPDHGSASIRRVYVMQERGHRHIKFEWSMPNGGS